jgi:hypothetical protein
LKALAVFWLRISTTAGSDWNSCRRKYRRVWKHSVTIPVRSCSVMGGSVGSDGDGLVVQVAEGQATMFP